MTDTIITALIAGAVGLVTGALGSLIAPWIHWGIEKKRKQFDRRLELVRRWREILSGEDFDRSKMLNDPAYGVLRPLLSPEVLKAIERPAVHISGHLGGPPITDHDRIALLHEIAEIEKMWELI